jgi:hypothetical protein
MVGPEKQGVVTQLRHAIFERDPSMTIDQAVYAFAGVMILLSLVLTALVSPLFVYFTAFIGLNLLQSAFTGFCPAALVFKAIGLKPGHAFR